MRVFDRVYAPAYAFGMIEGPEIRFFLKHTGWKQSQLAERLGITQPSVSRWLKGSIPDAGQQEKLRRLFSEVGAPIGGDQAPRTVPVLSWVNAGRLQSVETVLDTDVLRRITVGDLPPGEWFALEVDGDSMDRVAPSGSIIIVNRADDRLISDRFYVFATDEGEATFKRYRTNPERLVPYSFNPDHEPIYPEDGRVRVFGRVRRVIMDL